jgi:hypothetical protein
MVHMNPAEAVDAHLDWAHPRRSACTSARFQLTTEGIDEPLRALQDACSASGVAPQRFRTLGFGESMYV